LKECSKDPGRIQKDKKISIYEIFNKLRIVHADILPKQIFLALMFLYLVGAVEFQTPFIIIKKRNV
jgi:hypothetical protein